jgi:hypothetical protein
VRPPDLAPLVRALLVRCAVALGAGTALLSMWWGAPMHSAAGRGALAWFLVLALARVLVPLVQSSTRTRVAETSAGSAPASPE